MNIKYFAGEEAKNRDGAISKLGTEVEVANDEWDTTIDFKEKAIDNIDREDANQITVYLEECGFYIVMSQAEVNQIAKFALGG